MYRVCESSSCNKFLYQSLYYLILIIMIKLLMLTSSILMLFARYLSDFLVLSFFIQPTLFEKYCPSGNIIRIVMSSEVVLFHQGLFIKEKLSESCKTLAFYRNIDLNAFFFIHADNECL